MISVINGVDIAYDDIGAGQPVLFIHAFPLNRTMWAPQVSALVERCRCVAADLRGFGESAMEGQPSIVHYADDLAALLDHLRIEQAVVVGCSMGGYTALAMWRQHRDRVRALVLADTRSGADSDETRARRRQLIAVANDEGSLGVANVQIPSLVGKTTREKQPDTYDAVHRMMAQAKPAAIVGAIEAMMGRPDSTPMLATINVPTLIVVGEEDVPTPVNESRAMNALIPGSQLQIIAQAGHLSNLEKPAAFNHVLTEFIGTLTYA
ncbi:MAG TPA: alpha/beta fold hydrolase [Gemmatimonadaceae bacterium]